MQRNTILVSMLALGLSGAAVPALAQSVDIGGAADVTADVTIPGVTATTPTAPAAPTATCAEGDDACIEAQATAGASVETMPQGAATDDSADTAAMAGAGEGETLVTVASVADPGDLVGTRAYDSNGELVGSVSAVIPAEADGSGERLMVDVGGFLGFGARPVALPAEEILVAMSAEGHVERVLVSYTREDLQAMPEVAM